MSVDQPPPTPDAMTPDPRPRPGPIRSGPPAGDVAVAHDRIATIPNLLSVLRLLALPVFGWLVLFRHTDGWAAVLLGVAGLSDNLDGFIARRFDQVSRLGQLLDPIVDRVQVVVALVVLVVAGALPWYLAGLLVLREVVLAVVIAVLRSAGHGSLPVHYLGKIGTFGTVAALPLLLLGHGEGVATPLATLGTVLGAGFFYWGLTLYWCAGAVYVWQARRLLSPAPAIRTRRV